MSVVRGTARMYSTGPDAVHAVTGERVCHEQLGGADVHASRPGAAAFLHDDEEPAATDMRYLPEMLPPNNRELPPHGGSDGGPGPGRSASGVRHARGHRRIVADGKYPEVHERWAANIVCASARLGGQTVGIVADQPPPGAGALDIDASEKAARLVQMCATRSTSRRSLRWPGLPPGTGKEQQGVIRRGATVLRVRVIVRRAYIVMDSRSIGCDLRPTRSR